MVQHHLDEDRPDPLLQIAGIMRGPEDLSNNKDYREKWGVTFILDAGPLIALINKADAHHA